MTIYGVLKAYRPAECDKNMTPLDWESCRTCEGTGKLDPTATRARTTITDDGPVTVCGVCGGHGSLRAAALAGVKASSAYRNMLWPRFAPPKMERGEPTRTASLEVVQAHMQAITAASDLMDAEPTRCQDCGHPTGDPEWEGMVIPDDELTGYRSVPTPPGRMGSLGFREENVAAEHWADLHLRAAEMWLAEGKAPLTGATHYTRCDEGCRHAGAGVEGERPSERPPYPSKFGNGDDMSDTEGFAASAMIAQGYAVRASWRAVSLTRLAYPNMIALEDLAILCTRCWASRKRAGS